MKVLILSFSNNKVNEDSFIPNKKGLTFSCVDECMNELNKEGIEVEHICMNLKNIKRCMACWERGWWICLKEHKCIMEDDFNKIYNLMSECDGYIFITPVYFREMSESAKAFFDRLKRCDAFNKDSKIKWKMFISIACAGGSWSGTENTLNAFDVLNRFMNMKMIGRISVTKFNFNEQKSNIINSISKFKNYEENGMIFREAKLKDKEFILNANKEINILSGLNDSTFEKRIDKDLFEDKICKSIIAEIEGNIVGMILYSYVYWANCGRGIYISQAYVKSEYRGQGIFKQLLEQLKIKEYECNFITDLVGPENNGIKKALRNMNFKSSDLVTYYKMI